MKKTPLPAIAALILVASLMTACADRDDEIDIKVSELPANVVETIQNALPGINIKEAENETPKQTVKEKIIYEVEGVLLDGKEYEIKIRGDGVIIKIELEED